MFVDINFIKTGSILLQEQFRFCFKSVRAYITIDKTGPSVEEKAYINMALV